MVMRKMTARVVVVALLAPLLTLIGPSSPASAGFAFTERSLYGRNQAVVVDVGALNYTTGCDTGVDDYLYAVADLYVVRSSSGGSAPAGGLSDVSGTPNTVWGSFGGGFFGEVIGYTAPGGSIGPGTYGIAIDECQDGQFDPAVDTWIPDAFRVSAQVVGPELPNIGALKASAQRRADQFGDAEKQWQALLLANDVLTVLGGFTGVSGVAGVVYMLTTKAAVSFGAPDPGTLAQVALANQARHWKGLAADPPDPAFDQPTPLLMPAVPPALDTTDALAAAAAATVGPLTEGGELARALLASLERYQGAAAAGDGDWMLHHAHATQGYATLLAERLPGESAALDALADAVEALGADLDDEVADALVDIDGLLTAGPDAAGIADLTNHGFTVGSSAAGLLDLRNQLGDFDVHALATNLRDASAEADDLTAVLEALAVDMGPIIDTLAADPFVVGSVPVADVGGPYVGTVGVELTLDAGASSGPDGFVATWDLDGDGSFDDATGITPGVTPTAPGDNLIGVQVTAPDGAAAVAYAPLVVTGEGPPPPSLAVTPDVSPRSLTVSVGDSQTFTASTAGAGTVAWTLDGDEVGDGSEYVLAPTLDDAGTRRVTVALVGDDGPVGSVSWNVTVTGPDDDGDGYWANVDCDDDDPEVYPGAPELFDGKDNDCDPSTPDGGIEPDVFAGDAVIGSEGSAVSFTGTFTNVGGPYSATVDWGDGTTTPASVVGLAASATHTYLDDGNYLVELCVTSGSGRQGCDTTEATVANEPPLPSFGDLTDWAVEQYSAGAGNWTVAPDGLSVFQSINGDPTFFMAASDLGPFEAGVTLTVETAGDDDFVGFALGLQPGFPTDPDAEFLLIDWKQQNQPWAGGPGKRGLAVSRVQGIPSTPELWNHDDRDTNPAGGVTELARAATLGDTGWGNLTAHNFRFQYDEDGLRIWVEENLEFDLTPAEVGMDAFPLGRFGFYNYSQSSVRYSGYQLTPVGAVEGTDFDLTIGFEDPGVLDTHTGRVDWGDGSPVDALAIDFADGEGTATATHRYLDEGSYQAEICITDDGGDVGCQTTSIEVVNAPPVVDAGRDRVTGATLVLDDTTFSDPGILDTHTAVVDWGDGSPPEDIDVTTDIGQGRIDGEHTYTDDGTYTVEVCVTDDAGATGCDTLAVEVLAANQPPVAEAGDVIDATEGDTVAVGVAFTDPNPTDTHTATVSWGDGSPVETVALQDGGSVGSALPTHRYLDDGDYTVTFEVCDQDDACDIVTSTVQVANAAPEVAAEVEVVGAAADGRPVHVLSATFTDPGELDTHTATVDWGDGSGLQVTSVDQGAGSGTVSAEHEYDLADEFTVAVCVTDDGGATGCATVTVTTGLPSAPRDVTAIGGDGNARVRWLVPLDDGGAALVDYEVEVTPGETTTLVPATELSVVVGGLANDVDHTFRVRAANGFGWGPWSAPSNLARPRPGCLGPAFVDVGADHPFCPEITWMEDNGVAQGWPDDTYRPGLPITRQAMAAFSYRLLNPQGPEPAPCTVAPFADVAVDNTFCAEITWMRDAGVAGGFADGTFRPAGPVSRQAMSAFLYRLSGAPSGVDPPCGGERFGDVPVGHPFCGEIEWLVDTGVAEGFPDGGFRPGVAISRQAMAAFIFRYDIFTGFIGDVD